MGVTRAQALDRTLLLTRQHRVPDADNASILQALGSTSVVIVADEGNLATPAAQAAVVTLAQLVLMCGLPLRLAMPNVEVRGNQPPLLGSELVTAISDFAADSVPESRVDQDPASGVNDVVFVLGSSAWSGDAAASWRLAADSWSGSIQPVERPANQMSGQLPLGALAAAAIASVEAYRLALRSLVTNTRFEILQPRYLEPVAQATLALAPAWTPTSGFALGGLDAISGGALTTAMMHALLRVEDMSCAVRVWEPQTLEASNLNRYALLRRSMLGIPKIQMLERWGRPGCSVTGYEQLVDEALISSLGGWAPWVFVGSDNVPTRWLVQASWPKRLIVGATAGLMAVTSEHSRGRPCAACKHAWTEDVPGEIPTISFVSYMGGLLSAARLLRWAALGPAVRDEQADEAWVDRMDAPFGFRRLPVQRKLSCPLECAKLLPTENWQTQP